MIPLILLKLLTFSIFCKGRVNLWAQLSLSLSLSLSLYMYVYFCVCEYICIYVYVTPAAHKQHMYICTNSQQYIEWIKINYAFNLFYAFNAFIQSNFFFISMCVPWELNPWSFALLTQCSTSESQEHLGY